MSSSDEKDADNLKMLYHDFTNQISKYEDDYRLLRGMIKKQTNVCEINLIRGDSVVFNGGKYIHFTIPKFSGYREIFHL